MKAWKASIKRLGVTFQMSFKGYTCATLLNSNVFTCIILHVIDSYKRFYVCKHGDKALFIKRQTTNDFDE